MKVHGKLEKNKGTENTHLQMEIIMKVNSLRGWDLVKVNINGSMEVIMMVNGKLIKWMDEVFTEVVMEL